MVVVVILNQGSQTKSSHKGGLLAHTERLSFELQKRLNSRRFVNLAVIVLQAGIVQTPPPTRSRVHRRTYSETSACSLSAPHICLVCSVRLCTCVFTQECGFFLFFNRHLWLFFEVFSQTPFFFSFPRLTVMKNLIRVVFSPILRSPCFVLFSLSRLCVCVCVTQS